MLFVDFLILYNKVGYILGTRLLFLDSTVSSQIIKVNSLLPGHVLQVQMLWKL
jgi:hypothetical protein